MPRRTAVRSAIRWVTTGGLALRKGYCSAVVLAKSTFYCCFSSSGEEAQESCPICMEPIGQPNGATTACGHKFCLECLLKHSQIKDQCPMCRTEVPGASKTDWKAKYEEILHFARQQERYQQRKLSELVEKRNDVLQLQW